MERLYIGQSWSRGLVFCEILNFLNVPLQIWIINEFLNGRFLELGVNITKYGYEASVDELEIVFPKVSYLRTNDEMQNIKVKLEYISGGCIGIFVTLVGKETFYL